MIRRFNYTKRKQISRRHVRIHMGKLDSSEEPTFKAEIELESYNFDRGARVRIEAWRRNSLQRWSFGTVGRIEHPSEGDARLTDVPTPVQFRLLVVAPGRSGKLLGHCPRIRPVLPTRSLIPLREVELGQEVWRVDFGDGGDAPELQVNSSIEGISRIVRTDPSFRALVMPQVLRTILEQALIVEKADPSDEESTWSPWFRLARPLHPSNADPPVLQTGAYGENIHEAREWIEGVVASFASNPMKAAKTYGDAMEHQT